MKNIDITAAEIEMLRALPDFDITMILSDIDQFGWPLARKTLKAAHEACEKHGVLRVIDKRVMMKAGTA